MGSISRSEEVMRNFVAICDRCCHLSVVKPVLVPISASDEIHVYVITNLIILN
jgi:hypothetical protein